MMINTTLFLERCPLNAPKLRNYKMCLLSISGDLNPNCSAVMATRQALLHPADSWEKSRGVVPHSTIIHRWDSALAQFVTMSVHVHVLC